MDGERPEVEAFVSVSDALGVGERLRDEVAAGPCPRCGSSEQDYGPVSECSSCHALIGERRRIEVTSNARLDTGTHCPYLVPTRPVIGRRAPR